MRMFDYIKNSLISREVEIILVRGSAVNKDFINYGDIDIEVYLSKKPKIESFYNILRYRKKFILLTVYFYYFKDYYKKSKGKFPKDINVLYDKGNLINNLDFRKERPGVPKVINNYKKRFPRDYQLFLDHYFKLRRLYERGDKNKLKFYVYLMNKYCRRFIEKILKLKFKRDIDNYKSALKLARNTYKTLKENKIDKIIKDKDFNILFKKSEVIFK